MTAYMSEQNDISEYLNYMLVKTALTLLVNIKLSHIFWEEAISHINWLWNCLLLSDVSIIRSKTLYEVWFNDQKLNLHHIKIFRSLISVYMSIKTDRAKLDEKVFNSIFIDYQSEVMNHWVWNSVNQKIIWSSFVKMFESWKDSKLLSISDSEW